MAIIDKSGGWHGRLGDVVYFIRDAEQLIRDYVKNKDPKTTKQMLYRELTSEIGRLHIAAMVANAAIRGITITEKNSSLEHIPEDFYRRLLVSNQLALTCGWLKDEPMLLYADDMFLGEKFLRPATREYLIWADVVEDKICGLAFSPGAPKMFFRLAIRLKAKLAYKSTFTNWPVADAVEIEGQENPSPTSLDESLAVLPQFCRDRAAEFISRRFGKWSAKFRSRMLKGARIAYFELPKIPVPVSRFGVEEVKIADLSGGKIHLLIDLVGMTRFTRGDLTLYQCVATKPSKAKSYYTINLPQRELGEFGRELAERLHKQRSERMKKYLSNPAKLAAKRETHRRWRESHPENIKGYSKKWYQKIKSDPAKYAAALDYQRKWRRKHPDYNRQWAKKHHHGKK